MTNNVLAFCVWSASGQDQARTVAALVTIAAGQFSTIKRGGTVLISTTIGGENFSFQLPPGVSGLNLTQVHETWIDLEDISAEDFAIYLRVKASNVIQPIFGNAAQ